jgi:hypothetical protein
LPWALAKPAASSAAAAAVMRKVVAKFTVCLLMFYIDQIGLIMN